jgi:receptor protein-tyrosine kinase
MPHNPETLADRQQLSEQIRNLRALQEVPPVNFEQLDPAAPPSAPSAPHPKRNAAFALLISLVAAWLLAYALEWRDRRIKRLEDMERIYELPLIGAVPQVAGDVGEDGGPADSLREAHRTLRTNLQLSVIDDQLRTIIVVSAIPGEGKSTVVRNLALAYKEAGARVAIVESDLRNPVLAHRFMIQPQPGLTNVLAGAETLRGALQAAPGSEAVATLPATRATGANGNSLSMEGELSVLTSGPTPPNPPAVLSSKRVHTLLEEIAELYDIVLIDSPPLLAVSDAFPLLRLVDGIVVVGRLNWITRDAAQRVTDITRRPGNAPVLGIVANGVHERDFSALGVQPYGYGEEEPRRIKRLLGRRKRRRR